MAMAAEDRTVLITRIPFGLTEEYLLERLLESTVAMVEETEMGPSWTTFTAVYRCPLQASNAVQTARAHIATATSQLKTICVGLKSDIVYRGKVLLIEAKDTLQRIKNSDRMLFVRKVSPSSTVDSARRFFSGFGILDGCPYLYRSSRNGEIEIMGIVTFKTAGICVAAKRELQRLARFDTLELDGSKIWVEPYKPKKTSTMIEGPALMRMTSENYEQIANQLLGKEDDFVEGTLKNSIYVCLLNAGLCQLYKDDVEDLTESLERIRALDPTFEGTPECNFLDALAAALIGVDTSMFDDAVEVFNSNSKAPMIAWKTTLVSTLREYLIYLKELQELMGKEELEGKADPT